MHIYGNVFHETCNLFRIDIRQIEPFEIEIGHGAQPRGSLVSIRKRMRFDKRHKQFSRSAGYRRNQKPPAEGLNRGERTLELAPVQNVEVICD